MNDKDGIQFGIRFPLGEFGKDDSIALKVDGDTIISVSPDDVTKFMKSFGWKIYFCNVNNGKKLKFTDVYKDGRGNYVLVGYELMLFSEMTTDSSGKTKIINMPGFKVDPNGFLIEKDRGQENYYIVDLKTLIKTYSNNSFDQTIGQILKTTESRYQSSKSLYV